MKIDVKINGSGIGNFSNLDDKILNNAEFRPINQIPGNAKNTAANTVYCGEIFPDVMLQLWERFPLDKDKLYLHPDEKKALPILTSTWCPQKWAFCCMPSLYKDAAHIRLHR